MSAGAKGAPSRRKRRPLDRSALIHATMFASSLALMKEARKRGAPLRFAEACAVFCGEAATLRGQLNRYEKLPSDLVPALAALGEQLLTSAYAATMAPLFEKVQQVSTEKSLHELLVAEGQIPAGKSLSALKVFLRTRTATGD